MADKLGDFILHAEKIENLINAAPKDSLLTEKFSHAMPIWANDEHVRKVYLLVLFFAANAFMRKGLDGDELLSKVFRIAASISPDALNADEIRELMQQSITADTANNMDQNAQDLRQHDLMMPLFFHMLYMTEWVSKPECKDVLLKFAGKFDMSGTMQDVLDKNSMQERKDFFDAKISEQQQLASDTQRAEIREKRRRKEESLKGATPQKRYTDLYFFDKTYNLPEEMLNDLDALIKLALNESNYDDAVKWLYESIQLSNSPERRAQLLDLYKKQCPEGQEPNEFAYSKMIQEGIEGAKEDYESYKEQKKQLARQSAKASSSASSSDTSGGCGCLLVLLALAVGAWFFWPFSGSKQEQPEPPPAVEQQQKKEEPQQKKEEQPTAPVVSQAELTAAAVKALQAYHENITKHNFQEAYNYLGPSMQESRKYDDWLVGFQTTVSSTPYDIKVVQESPNQVVIAHSLKAVDNPGGEQVFSGQATMQNVNGSWKISDLEYESMKQLPSPVPAPAPKPSSPMPTSPPAPKPEVSYKTFTDEYYGFSFEYPASCPDLTQADSRGGHSAIEYAIDFGEKNPAEIRIGTEFTGKSTAQGELERDVYLWANNEAIKAGMIDATSYVFVYKKGNEERTRKVFYMGEIKYYIEVRHSGKLSSKRKEIVQHIFESFQPNS